MSTTETGDTPILDTRIPEGRTIPGVEYGAHISGPGWSGRYVRTGTCPQWGIALTPASDELAGDDRDILLALDDELEAIHAQAAYITAAIAEHGARAVHDAAMAHMDGSGSLAIVGLYPETMADSWRILRVAMDRLPADEDAMLGAVHNAKMNSRLE